MRNFKHHGPRRNLSRVVLELVQEIEALQYNDAYDVAIITVSDWSMTFGNSWGIANFDVDDLIDGAEYIDNVPRHRSACSSKTRRRLQDAACERERSAAYRVTQAQQIFCSCRTIRLGLVREHFTTCRIVQRVQKVLLLSEKQISFRSSLIQRWVEPSLEQAVIPDVVRQPGLMSAHDYVK
jgi:hypothetical protein